VLWRLYADEPEAADLKELGRVDAAERLVSWRILVIHSGGDSKRLPHCSATGKLFAHVPRTLPDGRVSTLFDELLISLSGAALELPPGVLVASGDVLLIFDHLQLTFRRPGVIGVAVASPAEVGTHHGVYVTEDGHRLRAYLHKPSLAQMRHWNAIADDGHVDIDTGLVWFDTPTVRRLVALGTLPSVAAFCGDQPSAALQTGLNLYGDLLMPLVDSTQRDDYMADVSDGPVTPAVRAARADIWAGLRGVAFTVERLQPAVFVHLGTSREYWQIVAASPEWAQTCGWTQHTASWVAEQARPGAQYLALMRAVVEAEVQVDGAPCLAVDSWIGASAHLGGGCLIAGLHTDHPLHLSRDVIVHQVPIAGGGYVTRVLGISDNPKRGLDDPAATFLNQPWAAWLAQSGVDPEALWPGLEAAERTLWTAQLYPLCAERQESLRLTLPLQDAEAMTPAWRAEWTARRRLSLAEGFALADGERLLAEVRAIEDRVAVRQFEHAVVAERPASQAAALLGALPAQASPRGEGRRAAQVAERLAEADPILRLRAYKALAEATGEEAWEDRAFALLAEMIERDVRGRHPIAGGAADRERHFVGQSDLCVDAAQGVRVQVAARIDFGGGWTDTPPYSIERGGTVLNAAITLNGTYPVSVEAWWFPEGRRTIALESSDIDATIEPSSLREVLSYSDPADPFALLKAALVLRGVVSSDGAGDAPVSDVLRTERGLYLRTQTSIPRGSGLGTSSILAGAVLACLARLCGVELSQEQLFDEVLYLEQMLTTGGGWQDQVGGLVGGIKLITTEPGLPQRPRIEPAALSPAVQQALSERLLLVYTGQRRLAKNLLRSVMGRWMARDAEMVWIQDEIARLAVVMRDALESGDLTAFGALLSEHWTLNKRMDPGCTNPFIDGLFDAMAPFIVGGKLAGAGGGGFAIVVARDADARHALARALQARYPGTPVAIWPCAIAEKGMDVSVEVRPGNRPGER